MIPTDIADQARAVRFAARELATEHGFSQPCPAVAGSLAGARFITKPIGPELASLLESYPVTEWVDQHWSEILTRAGVGGAA